MEENHEFNYELQAQNVCRFCGMVLKKKRYMYEHIRTKHGTGDGLNLSCEFCGKLYGNTRYLKNHIKACHTINPEACPVCLKVCDNRTRVREHLSKVHKTSMTKVLELIKSGDLP